MNERPDAPDVLVLGAGGILGEAWMLAVLAGLEEATGIDVRESGSFVGTSAGSIVAATLAARVSPHTRIGELPQAALDERPDDTEPEGADVLGEVAGAALRLARAGTGLIAPLALASTATGGALLRRAALSRVPRGRRSLSTLGREIDRNGLDWDGRMLIATVELETGRRVVFGAPGAPRATVAEAVEASCAIPGVFRPIAVNGRSYVDGGAWSPTNMDAATVNPGARVLCLNPTAALRPSREAPFGALGPVSRAVAGLEALTLERRGAKVRTVAPDEASAAALGTNFMDARRRTQVIAAGVEQGRALNWRTE
jgi:NTE family protein